jgi:4-hydroxy-2-oxoglutarate aldolase
MAPPPAPGVWCPAVTFYTDSTTSTLDLAAQSKYFTYLSQSGLTGLGKPLPYIRSHM